MSTAFQAAGAQSRPTKYAALWSDTFFTGLWTQRNPLRDAATPFIYRRYYGATRYESLWNGLNMEMSPRLTLVRRPGTTVYNSQIFPAINIFYEFRKFSPGTAPIQLIADTGESSGVIYDATGPSTKDVIFTKGAGAGRAYFQSIGNVLYFGDDVETKKYLSNGSSWVVQNWGISTNSGTGTFGPNTAAAGVDGGGSGSIWSNPGNVSSAVSYATVATQLAAGPTNTAGTGGFFSRTYYPNVSGTEGPIVGSNFGFNIPSGATITGIVVTYTHYVNNADMDASADQVRIYKAGVPVGTPKGPGSSWAPVTADESWGTSSDLWGTTWTAAEVNDPGFGFSLSYLYENTSTSFSRRVTVSNYRITVYYTAGSGGAAYSDPLIASQFAFTVPAGTSISGIGVSFGGSCSGDADVQVQLVQSGSVIGSSKTVTTLGTVPATVVLGSSSDLWGATINASVVDDTTFGVQFFVPTGGFGTTAVNNVQITVYSSGQPVATPTGVGTFSATAGYRYVYCYGNSIDGGCSTATQPSAIGVGADTNFTNASYVGVTVEASTDPQVNQIRVFRTKDGGSIYYELPASPYSNTSGTIQDNAPDSQLNTAILAPLDGYNDPPPDGLNRPTYHAGRMWGAVDNNVDYSRAPDQSVPGVSVQCFPPANTFQFPDKVIRLIPTIYGLLVFLISDTWLIQGTGDTNSPFIPVSFVPLVGVASYSALSQNGSLLYFYTSDRQLVAMDPNAGVSEVGFPIGDILEQDFSAEAAQVTYHPGGSSDKAVYITNGNTDWYRISPVATPEQGQMISPVARPVGGFSAVQSVEVTGGTHYMLLGPATSGPILQRNLNVVTDNGASYPCFATLGSVVLAQPGQLAELSFLAADYKGVALGGSEPDISVLLDDTEGTFEALVNSVNEPPTLPPSTFTVGSRWYFSQGAAPAWCRHLQVKFSWGATSTFDEILSYTIYGAHHQEK